MWLPRLLEKARRCETLGSGRRVDGYLYGDNDYFDKMIISFLRTDDATISALVREDADDADVARILVERSGRNAAECAAFNAAFRRKSFNCVLLEADEGRLGSGPKAALLKFLYNNALMPVIYRLFQRDERKRGAPVAQ